MTLGKSKYPWKTPLEEIKSVVDFLMNLAILMHYSEGDVLHSPKRSRYTQRTIALW